MRTSLWALAVTLFISSSAKVLGQPSSVESFLLTEKVAIGTSSAEFAVGPGVQTATWSPSGKNLLISRLQMKLNQDVLEKALAGKITTPPGESQLVQYNTETGKTTTVWRAQAADAQVSSTTYLSRSDSALAIVQVRHQTKPEERQANQTVLLHISGGSSRPILSVATNSVQLELISSPYGPYALVKLDRFIPREVVAQDGKKQMLLDVQTTLQFVGHDGRLTKAEPLAAPLRYLGASWAANGKLVVQCLNAVERKPAGKNSKFSFLSVDPETMAASSVDGIPAAPERTPSKLSIVQSRQALKLGKASKTTMSLWLQTTDKTEVPTALVTADASWGAISPDEKRVAYLSDGNLMVADLIRLSKDAFIAARDAARQVVLMSNGKQVALAALMYSQDNNDVLPGANDNLVDKLLPYLMNQDLLNGLVFTFGGGALKDVADPAGTELGHIPGPGGRAVMYVDGHVKWKKD